MVLAMLLIGVVIPNPFTPGDAARYHIPRAHYWIENGTARHFYTDNYRQVEFPPNTAFFTMWQILVTGSYQALHLPQWFAGVLTALAIFCLAKFGSFSSGASTFAGLSYLSLSGVLLQMGTPLNDLTTGLFGTSCIYFSVTSVTKRENGNTSWSAPRVALAGVS
jgi:hypothetical protein